MRVGPDAWIDMGVGRGGLNSRQHQHPLESLGATNANFFFERFGVFFPLEQNWLLQVKIDKKR